jgi:hypothetical protein
MSAGPLVELCQRIRPELACLGDLGEPLLDVVTLIERLAGESGVGVLCEPAFALDVLAAAGGDADPAVMGRVLDSCVSGSGLLRHGSSRPPHR